MKKKYTRNIKKLRRTQGCLTDCVAYVLNIHPEKVPYFVYPREGWNNRLKNFFKKHGYEIKWRLVLQHRASNHYKLPKTGTHLVLGDSLKWKTYSHAVIYKNGEMVYDPNYPSKWQSSRITHRLILTKIK